MSAYVLVDSRVLGLEQLLLDLPAATRVVMRDPSRDGLAQIAAALAGAAGVDSIHIVSHGASGTLFLGSTILDAASLDSYRAELALIGSALSADGDILLYGCDVGAGAEGHSFVQ